VVEHSLHTRGVSSSNLLAGTNSQYGPIDLLIQGDEGNPRIGRRYSDKHETHAIQRSVGFVVQGYRTPFSLKTSDLTDSLQGFPFLSGGLWFWLLLLLGGGFSFFGATTTVFGGFGGRSPLFWANAPVATKQPIATATIFCLKSNIEFLSSSCFFSAHGRES
jgi:hypothetical protein